MVMISKNLFKNFIVFLVSLCSFSLQGQNKLADQVNQQFAFDLINNYNNYVNSFYEGEIYLNNNKKITGRFSLNNPEKNDTYSVIQNDGNKCQYIMNDTINSIILFSEDKNENITETKFTKLPNSEKFYRIISNDGDKVKMYDSAKKPFDSNLIGEVFIKEEEKIVSTYNFWYSGPKKGVINYINKRDNKKFKRRDFKTVASLVNYLNKS